MQPPTTIPVMPMRHAVVYPGLPTPLGVTRALSREAVLRAESQRGFLFAVAQRTPVVEPSADDLHRVGVVVRLLEVKRGEAEWEVLLHGVTRARATEYRRDGAIFTAVVEPMFDVLPDDPEAVLVRAADRELRERLLELGDLRRVPPPVLREVLAALSEPGVLADFVASYVELPTVTRQSLLETTRVTARMTEALSALVRQIEVERAQGELRDKVAGEIAARQRESFLREQLEVIRRELGEDDRNDVEPLVARLEELPLPERVRPEVRRECRRLRRANPESSEAQVLRTYLEWIGELPWHARSEDRLDLERATEILAEDHHGLVAVKDRVLEYLAVRALRARRGDGAHDTEPPQGGKVLLFHGPPGVGKTSVAASIARALGRSYVRVALGGVHDESDIRGHRRTYVGAMPGRIVDGLRAAGTRNPVFVLDEIDKLGKSWQGDPAHALLEALDPAQNDSFTDHYLNVPFDLRDVLFIATANGLDTIPPPLLDRMELVAFDGYAEADKVAIGRRFLLPRAAADAGLPCGPTWDDEALVTIVRERTRESGVRQLEREIAGVFRKLARRHAEGGALPERVTADDVRRLLGRARVRYERTRSHDEVGTATGMYFTPAGGDIMFVEAAVRGLGRARGDGLGEVTLVLTGHLGEIMRESARTAVTVATHLATRWALPTLTGPFEAHVHVPAGAVPKDGPSAGLAMAVALVSAFASRRVRRDVALTGEITLSGRVLPVGGVEEKLLGAERAGVRHVVLPRENLADLGSLPAEVLARLAVHPVDTVHEALGLALAAEGGAEPATPATD